MGAKSANSITLSDFRQAISQRPRGRAWTTRALGACLLALGAGAAAANPLDPPPAEVLDEARAIVEAMKNAERGPYLRIRWFCNDGSVQPPVAFACRERGGGRQHAEYSPARARLAELGWSVGTIFAATDWRTLWSGDERRTRLRELALERYMIDVDDGWVLSRARHYRGRIQVEDEEEAGRALLLALMAEHEWLDENFLAAREVVRAIPHHAGEDLLRRIRRTAQDLAERDASFERLRVETHTSPSAATAARIRAWAETAGRDAALAAQARQLADALDRLYGATGRAER
ncbi:MAG: hypothetical protein R3286_03390, partial [Gammaproteobacteria bacterium]|nr:hypothetical protein [Gammaproteobacteria bacterium]